MKIKGLKRTHTWNYLSDERVGKSSRGRDALFTRDSAGLWQYSAENAKQWRVGAAEVQLPDFLAGQQQRGTQLSVGAFEIGHNLDQLN